MSIQTTRQIHHVQRRRYRKAFPVHIKHTAFLHLLRTHTRSQQAKRTHSHKHILKVKQLKHIHMNMQEYSFLVSRMRNAYVNCNLNAIWTQQIVKCYLNDLQINEFVWYMPLRSAIAQCVSNAVLWPWVTSSRVVLLFSIIYIVERPIHVRHFATQIGDDKRTWKRLMSKQSSHLFSPNATWLRFVIFRCTRTRISDAFSTCGRWRRWMDGGKQNGRRLADIEIESMMIY